MRATALSLLAKTPITEVLSRGQLPPLLDLTINTNTCVGGIAGDAVVFAVPGFGPFLALFLGGVDGGGAAVLDGPVNGAGKRDPGKVVWIFCDRAAGVAGGICRGFGIGARGRRRVHSK